MPEQLPAIWVTPGVIGRLRAERLLKSRCKPSDQVLCFHNLPPLLKISAPFDIYLHNRFVVDGDLRQMGLRTFLRLAAERILFRLGRSRARRVIVQSRSMSEVVQAKYGDAKTMIVPFAPSGPTRIGDVKKTIDLFYPATPGPHKNHEIVARALAILADQGVHLRLAVVAPLDSPERAAYEALSGTSIAVDLLEYLTIEQVHDVYDRSRGLLFASVLESFGLPLIEASRAGLAIVAPELDYVRDVCEPSETFDPRSAVSLARAISRYLGIAEKKHPVLPARDIVNSIID